MARNTRTFSDLDLNFIAHPGTGDVTLKYDEQSIKQSLKNLILTQNYERPFHSEIGSQLRGLLFENVSPMLDILLQRAIVDTITNFEPRVRLLNVIANVSPDNNEVYVTIEFTIINTTTPIKVDLVLKRTR
jgi:hypothetical protein